MTEKRFTVHTLIEDYEVGEDDLKGHMVEILDNGNHMTYKECCDLLNKQHKQLERLENVLQSFSKRDLLDVERIFLQNICKELKEDWE